MTAPYTPDEMRKFPWQYQDKNEPSAHDIVLVEMRQNVKDIEAKVDQILAALAAGGGGTPAGNVTLHIPAIDIPGTID